MARRDARGAAAFVLFCLALSPTRKRLSRDAWRGPLRILDRDLVAILQPPIQDSVPQRLLIVTTYLLPMTS